MSDPGEDEVQGCDDTIAVCLKICDGLMEKLERKSYQFCRRKVVVLSLNRKLRIETQFAT